MKLTKTETAQLLPLDALLSRKDITLLAIPRLSAMAEWKATGAETFFDFAPDAMEILVLCPASQKEEIKKNAAVGEVAWNVPAAPKATTALRLNREAISALQQVMQMRIEPTTSTEQVTRKAAWTKRLEGEDGIFATFDEGKPYPQSFYPLFPEGLKDDVYAAIVPLPQNQRGLLLQVPEKHCGALESHLKRFGLEAATVTRGKRVATLHYHAIPPMLEDILRAFGMSEEHLQIEEGEAYSSIYAAAADYLEDPMLEIAEEQRPAPKRKDEKAGRAPLSREQIEALLKQTGANLEIARDLRDTITRVELVCPDPTTELSRRDQTNGRRVISEQLTLALQDWRDSYPDSQGSFAVKSEFYSSGEIRIKIDLSQLNGTVGQANYLRDLQALTTYVAPSDVAYELPRLTRYPKRENKKIRERQNQDGIILCHDYKTYIRREDLPADKGRIPVEEYDVTPMVYTPVLHEGQHYLAFVIGTKSFNTIQQEDVIAYFECGKNQASFTTEKLEDGRGVLALMPVGKQAWEGLRKQCKQTNEYTLEKFLQSDPVKNIGITAQDIDFDSLRFRDPGDKKYPAERQHIRQTRSKRRERRLRGREINDSLPEIASSLSRKIQTQKTESNRFNDDLIEWMDAHIDAEQLALAHDTQAAQHALYMVLTEREFASLKHHVTQANHQQMNADGLEVKSVKIRGLADGVFLAKLTLPPHLAEILSQRDFEYAEKPPSPLQQIRTDSSAIRTFVDSVGGNVARDHHVQQAFKVDALDEMADALNTKKAVLRYIIIPSADALEERILKQLAQIETLKKSLDKVAEHLPKEERAESGLVYSRNHYSRDVSRQVQYTEAQHQKLLETLGLEVEDLMQTLAWSRSCGVDSKQEAYVPVLLAQNHAVCRNDMRARKGKEQRRGIFDVLQSGIAQRERIFPPSCDDSFQLLDAANFKLSKQYGKQAMGACFVLSPAFADMLEAQTMPEIGYRETTPISLHEASKEISRIWEIDEESDLPKPRYTARKQLHAMSGCGVVACNVAVDTTAQQDGEGVIKKLVMGRSQQIEKPVDGADRGAQPTLYIATTSENKAAVEKLILLLRDEGLFSGSKHYDTLAPNAALSEIFTRYKRALAPVATIEARCDSDSIAFHANQLLRLRAGAEAVSEWKFHAPRLHEFLADFYAVSDAQGRERLGQLMDVLTADTPPAVLPREVLELCAQLPNYLRRERTLLEQRFEASWSAKDKALLEQFEVSYVEQLRDFDADAHHVYRARYATASQATVIGEGDHVALAPTDSVKTWLDAQVKDDVPVLIKLPLTPEAKDALGLAGFAKKNAEAFHAASNTLDTRGHAAKMQFGDAKAAARNLAQAHKRGSVKEAWLLSDLAAFHGQQAWRPLEVEKAPAAKR